MIRFTNKGIFNTLFQSVEEYTELHEAAFGYPDPNADEVEEIIGTNPCYLLFEDGYILASTTEQGHIDKETFKEAHGNVTGIYKYWRDAKNGKGKQICLLGNEQ